MIINFSIKTSNISKITPDDFYRRNTLPVEEEKKNNHSVNFANPYHNKKKSSEIFIYLNLRIIIFVLVKKISISFDSS